MSEIFILIPMIKDPCGYDTLQHLAKIFLCTVGVQHVKLVMMWKQYEIVNNLLKMFSLDTVT